MVNIRDERGRSRVAACVMALLFAMAGLRSAAAPRTQVLGAWTYAYAEYGSIKYPEGFEHYDFVNPNAPKGGTIRLSNPDRRTSFDKYNPFTLPDSSPAATLIFLFETLTDPSPDEPATMYGLLASQMLVAPDLSSISFRLNPLARFNNGDPVTAEDVKYSFEMATSLVAQPWYAQYFDDIRDAVVLDAHTIRFDLKTPSRDQIFRVGAQLYVFSRKWGQDAHGRLKPFNQILMDLPITTGPYSIVRGTGQILELKRRPDYWARDQGVRRGFYNFDHIVYHYYSDQAARFEGLKSGDSQIMEEYSAKRFVRLFVGHKFRDGEIVKKFLPLHVAFTYEGFMINTRRPQFADLRVRSALNYAFDWAWSVKQGYDIYGRYNGFFENSEFAATGLPSPGELALLEPYRRSLPPAVFGVPEPNPVSDTSAKLRANLLHARDLLAAAGWTIHPDGVLRNARGEAFQMEILEDNQEFEPIIGRWVESLRKLGITARTRVVDFAVYDKRMTEFDYDVTLINLGDTKIPSSADLIGMLSSKAARSPGSNNYAGVSSPAVDHMIDALTRATTLQELIDSSRALNRIFIAEHYAIPYQYRPTKMVAYWDVFGIPATMPRYYSIDDGLNLLLAWPVTTWWAR